LINPETGIGDCLEVKYCPEGMTRMPEMLGYDFIIRQITIDRWLIWRRK
jgi:hypothetical protein